MQQIAQTGAIVSVSPHVQQVNWDSYDRPVKIGPVLNIFDHNQMRFTFDIITLIYRKQFQTKLSVPIEKQ